MNKYEENMNIDQNKRRINTHENFWHNYKALCRLQANNPAQAIDVAKSIIQEMPTVEKKKLKEMMQNYERVTKSSFDERLRNYYNDSVANLPIKNTSIHSEEALETIKYNTNMDNVKGHHIDAKLKTKIGDTLDIQLTGVDISSHKKTKYPTISVEIAAISTDLNKIVLMDNVNNSKYTLALDEFIKERQRTEKLELKKNKKIDKITTTLSK